MRQQNTGFGMPSPRIQDIESFFAVNQPQQSQQNDHQSQQSQNHAHFDFSPIFSNIIPGPLGSGNPPAPPPSQQTPPPQYHLSPLTAASDAAPFLSDGHSFPARRYSAQNNNDNKLTSTNNTATSGAASRRRYRLGWTDEETAHLIQGCRDYGVGNWKKILLDPRLKFNNRTAVDLKDRFRTSCPEEYARLYPNARTHKTRKNSISGEGSTKTLVKISRKERRAFTLQEDQALLTGFERYGPQWSTIQRDQALGLGSRRSTDLRDRFRNAFPDRYAAAGYKGRCTKKRSATPQAESKVYTNSSPTFTQDQYTHRPDYYQQILINHQQSLMPMQLPIPDMQEIWYAPARQHQHFPQVTQPSISQQRSMRQQLPQSYVYYPIFDPASTKTDGH